MRTTDFKLITYGLLFIWIAYIVFVYLGHPSTDGWNWMIEAFWKGLPVNLVGDGMAVLGAFLSLTSTLLLIETISRQEETESVNRRFRRIENFDSLFIPFFQKLIDKEDEIHWSAHYECESTISSDLSANGILKTYKKYYPFIKSFKNLLDLVARDTDLDNAARDKYFTIIFSGLWVDTVQWLQVIMLYAFSEKDTRMTWLAYHMESIVASWILNNDRLVELRSRFPSSKSEFWFLWRISISNRKFTSV